MSLPIYHNITVKTTSFEDLTDILAQELNLKHPVVINVKALDFDQQRETIGLIENYFVTHEVSFKFPYPVYIITDQEATVAGLPLVRVPEELPKFFIQRDGKLNVKEAHLIGKNKLLQQEIRNGENSTNENEIKVYGKTHQQIHLLENESHIYKMILTRLVRAKNNG
jgi:hypothetical protein